MDAVPGLPDLWAEKPESKMSRQNWQLLRTIPKESERGN